MVKRATVIKSNHANTVVGESFPRLVKQYNILFVNGEEYLGRYSDGLDKMGLDK